jgi:hypothetical protein
MHMRLPQLLEADRWILGLFCIDTLKVIREWVYPQPMCVVLSWCLHLLS